MNAIKDLIYMIGLWLIMRVNPYAGGELLETWGKGVQKRIIVRGE